MADVDYSLYLATDRAFLAGRDLCQVVANCIENGVSLVQLREKDCSSREFYDLGRRVHEVTCHYDIPLIINDRVDIMLALDAEGVHIGRHDVPLEKVRALAGHRIVGYSVKTEAELAYAEKAGADYVGIGPVFPTGTKLDAGEALGVEHLRGMVKASGVPCVAIGGISAENAGQLSGFGLGGICVISAILNQADPGAAARRLRDEWHSA
jgi:thiamine-phosphate pyrophosphorylase